MITGLHKRVCSDFKKFVKLELKSFSAGSLVIGARTVDVEQSQGSRLAGNLEKVLIQILFSQKTNNNKKKRFIFFFPDTCVMRIN
jgi:hypothetical protein